MWLGIAIALVFFTAGAAVAVTGIYRIWRRKNWLSGVVMLVPAVLFLGFLGSFAGPALMIEIFGDPNVQRVSADARKIEGDELLALYEGQIHKCQYYDEDERQWYHYEENHLPSGSIRGKGGPESDPTLWSWSGQWKVENDLACASYDGTFACNGIYVDGEVYQAVSDGQVSSWFVLREPQTVLEPDAERLLGDDLRGVIDGMTHEGTLVGAQENGVFRMVFHGENHAIHTRRGDDAESLVLTEYGWYRFDDDGFNVCISGTLGIEGRCFGVWRSGDSYNFVETGVAVTLQTTMAF